MLKASFVVSAVAGLAASSALAQDFYNQGAFQAAAAGAGCAQQFVEDFEEASGYFITGMGEPLTQGVPNGPFLTGLTWPITVQSNLMGDGGASLMPRGGSQPLAAFEGGFGFTATDAVIANYFVDGFDILTTGGNVCAVGFNTVNHSGGGNVQIQIFDTSNALLGTFNSASDASEKDFFGFVSNTPIGRINIWDPSSALAEGGDNVEVWTAIPAPGAAALLGLSVLAAGRRRR